MKPWTLTISCNPETLKPQNLQTSHTWYWFILKKILKGWHSPSHGLPSFQRGVERHSGGNRWGKSMNYFSSSQIFFIVLILQLGGFFPIIWPVWWTKYIFTYLKRYIFQKFTIKPAILSILKHFQKIIYVLCSTQWITIRSMFYVSKEEPQCFQILESVCWSQAK